jgi:hypothetical protein
MTPGGASAEEADHLYSPLLSVTLVNEMHPCCWENMLQGLIQMVPFFALFAVAAKKLWDGRLSHPLRRRGLQVQSQSTGSCCSKEIESLKRQPSQSI